MPFKDPARQREANRKSYAKYREARKAALRAAHARDPVATLLRVRRRQAGLRTKTPRWHDRTVVRAIYLVAAAWRSAGEDVHVDHIIPLAGKDVTGLHVHENLTILPARVNLSKSIRT